MAKSIENSNDLLIFCNFLFHRNVHLTQPTKLTVELRLYERSDSDENCDLIFYMLTNIHKIDVKCICSLNIFLYIN